MQFICIQVTRQKRELDRKNSGITTMLQAIAAKMKSNDPKKAALSAPAVTECHERKKAATFNEEMKLSEMVKILSHRIKLPSKAHQVHTISVEQSLKFCLHQCDTLR